MPVDPSFTIYRDQLTTLSHGLALWNPNPQKNIYNNVSIGDVGYLHIGTFIRMFNVTLPWNHPSNGLLGIPEPYDRLDCGPFTHTIEAHFDQVDYYSRFVTAKTDAGDPIGLGPDELEGVTYTFRNRGALLSLPNGGHNEDAIHTKLFEDYIRDHVDKWFSWAKNNKLGVERMEDLILVSGCTLVTAWAAAAFQDDTKDAEITLASGTLDNGTAIFEWSNIRGRVLYHNSRFEPDSTVTQDQCVFIRGFRVKRVLFRIRPIQLGSSGDDENSLHQLERRTRVPQRNEALRNNLSSLPLPPHIGGSSSSLDTTENPHRHPILQRNDGSRSVLPILGDDSHIGGSSSSLDTMVELPISPPYRHPSPLQGNDGLRRTSPLLSDDSHVGGSSSDTIDPLINHENQHPTLQRNDGLRGVSPILEDDSHIRSPSPSSSLDTIVWPPINDETLNDGEKIDDEDLKDDNFDGENLNDENLDENLDDENLNNENLQHPPHRHPALQRSDAWRSATGPSFPRGSSSSSATAEPPVNYDNPQLRPYPSSTTLQSNGSICNASFVTTPSNDSDSLLEVPDDIAGARRPQAGNDRLLQMYLAGSKNMSRLRRGYKPFP